MFKQILKTGLRFGGAGAIIVFAYTTIISRTGIIYSDGIGQYLGFFAIVVMPICTFLAIKELSNVCFEGKVKFQYAMVIGILVSLVAATIYLGVRKAESLFFSDFYMEKRIEEVISNATELGMEKSQITERVNEIKKYYSSWKPVQNTYKWYLLLGTIYTLGSFLILKYLIKKPNQ